MLVGDGFLTAEETFVLTINPVPDAPVALNVAVSPAVPATDDDLILSYDYLDVDIFKNENIDVVFEKFEYPQYSQKYPKFIPNMSIIDLLFNEGEKSIEILKNSNNYS